MILEAVLLGLSTGTYCAMYCGPVLIWIIFGFKACDVFCSWSCFKRGRSSCK